MDINQDEPPVTPASPPPPDAEQECAGEPDYWEQREAAKKLPGLFTNQIYVHHLGDGLLRVNFGEILDEEPRFHSALVVTAHNAYAFGQLMMKMASAADALTRSGGGDGA